MKLAEYCKNQGRGSTNRLANAVGAYASDVSAWSNGGRPVPVKFAVMIEAVTQRQVTRQELCPDWAQIWPELVSASQSDPA